MTRDFPPGELRVSDTERDRAIAELSEHFQSGRLSQDEFDERSGLALRARTGNDLRELFNDLPGIARQPETRPERAPLRARRRPSAKFVIACVLALTILGNVASGVSTGFHHFSVGWVVPVVIMLIVLRRIGRR